MPQSYMCQLTVLGCHGNYPVNNIPSVESTQTLSFVLSSLVSGNSVLLYDLWAIDDVDNLIIDFTGPPGA